MIPHKVRGAITKHQRPEEDPVDTLIRILTCGEERLGDLVQNAHQKCGLSFLEGLRWFLGNKLGISMKGGKELLDANFVDLLQAKGIRISRKLQGILEDKYTPPEYRRPTLKTLREVVTVTESSFLRRRQAGNKSLQELQEHLKSIDPTLCLGMKL